MQNGFVSPDRLLRKVPVRLELLVFPADRYNLGSDCLEGPSACSTESVRSLGCCCCCGGCCCRDFSKGKTPPVCTGSAQTMQMSALAATTFYLTTKSPPAKVTCLYVCGRASIRERKMRGKEKKSAAWSLACFSRRCVVAPPSARRASFHPPKVYSESTPMEDVLPAYLGEYMKGKLAQAGVTAVAGASLAGWRCAAAVVAVTRAEPDVLLAPFLPPPPPLSLLSLLLLLSRDLALPSAPGVESKSCLGACLVPPPPAFLVFLTCRHPSVGFCLATVLLLTKSPCG